MEKKPYFIRVQDYEQARLAGMLPPGTVAFLAKTWVLVTFTDEQKAAYKFPIVEFYGQEYVKFYVVMNN